MTKLDSLLIWLFNRIFRVLKRRRRTSWYLKYVLEHECEELIEEYKLDKWEAEAKYYELWLKYNGFDTPEEEES